MQVPDWHEEPFSVSQAVQALPPLPHSQLEVPGRQLPPIVQHPPKQLPWLHWQKGVPPLPPAPQYCPEPHWSSLPQRHTPSSQRVERPAVQAWQAPPPRPHVAVPPSCARHWLPSQQPLGHESASQTHVPPRQRWPGAQAGLLPHRHAPLAQTLVPASAVQSAHWLPALPHEALVGGVTQVVPWQHPVAQDAASHTHTPFWHRWPTAQGAPLLPHWQPPAIVQALERLSQLAHATPPPPHRGKPVVSQLAPLQQPLTQLAAVQPVQAFPVQLSVPQLAQAAPPVPQAVPASPGRHCPPLQQPVGHDDWLHTHEPLTQACPAPQAGEVPHRHAPLVHRSARVATQVPQLDAEAPHADVVWFAGVTQAVVPAQQPVVHEPGVHTHEPPWHARPGPQGGPFPQPQVPPSQPSALAPQGAQAWPLAPHEVFVVGVMHWPPLQHPAQLVVSHTQLVPSQRRPGPQGAPAPQPHPPSPWHREAVTGLHAAQLLPRAPQLAAVVGVTQVLPLQQPLGQLVASQTQVVPLHTWPGWQAGPVPHAHWPPTQALLVGATHAWQKAPPVPHWLAVWLPGPTQLPLAQQPLAHVAAPQPSHAWLVQAPAQPWQATPPRPHSPGVVPARHWPVASQHPLGQLVASHWQLPLTQRCPSAHAAPVPQRQAPEGEQAFARVALHAVQAWPGAPQ